MIIGLLSDTHSLIDKPLITNLQDCDEIWHAGDIGSFEVLDTLKKICLTRAVSGNVDDQLMRREIPPDQIFFTGEMKVWMTHIGGYPGRYDKRVREQLQSVKPDILICGHSHILKIVRDDKNGLLYINPGAAGIFGIHKYRTLVKMEIVKGKINKMKVIELSKEKLSQIEIKKIT